MKLSSIFLATLAPLALASDGCLNENFDHDPLGITPTMSRRALTDLRTRDIAGIDLYIHVLVAKNPTEDFGPSINKQLQFLNGKFNKWGYNFNLRLTTYVISPEWAKDIDVDKTNKMRTLHKGDYQTLNVYMVESAGGGVCSLPDSSGNPVDQDRLDFDGCFIPLSVGRSPNSGTLAHEIGHWLGLLHTFQGGCTGNGDYCDDTAPQEGPSYGKMAKPNDLQSCPAKETCGAGKGFQNIKNFMDYTDCSQEFTPCQGGRMAHSWNVLRKGRKLAAGVKVKW